MVGGRNYQLNTSVASTPNLSRNSESYWTKGGKKEKEHLLKKAFLSRLTTKPTLTRMPWCFNCPKGKHCKRKGLTRSEF